MSDKAENLQRIYQRRFNPTAAYRHRVWGVLTRSFFCRWISPESAVLDLGCGYGEFINNVRAASKFAMDLNPDSPAHLNDGIRFLSQDCSKVWPLPDDSLDTVFTSNFFEHLSDKAALRETLRQALRCLKPGGKLIALGPNIKYLPGRYWDFFDHHIALTESSLAEALEVEGFSISRPLRASCRSRWSTAPTIPCSSCGSTWRCRGCGGSGVASSSSSRRSRPKRREARAPSSSAEVVFRDHPCQG